MKRFLSAGAGIGLACLAQIAVAQAPVAPASAPSNEQSLLELRNTVVNILQGLVQRGVLTQQDAQTIVADAQKRAATEIAELKARETPDENAVRVTYVPEIVKDEIRAAVREDVQGAVVDDVVERAKKEGWGVPGALPAWVRNIDIDTRLRVRGEGDYFDPSNAQNVYLDFNAINAAGGIGKAGVAALMNATEDRGRLRGRLRVDLTSKVSDRLTARLTFGTGNFNEPTSMNQTFANYGRRLNFAVQNAAIEWNFESERATRDIKFLGGRFDNPFLSTEMLWDEDLSFEGVATKVAFDVFRRHEAGVQPGLSVLVGAFPLEEVALAGDDKWLYAGQIGLEVPFGERSAFRLAAAHYQFRNIVGLRNAPDSKLKDYTVPALFGRGNTLFDIRNDTDPTTNLFALASDFRITDFTAQLDFAVFGANRLRITADVLENRGFDAAQVALRVGSDVAPRTKGRALELSIGRETVRQRGDWRVFATHRHLERDAVLDVFTDSDFGLGGTDTQGYILGFDIGVSKNAYLRTKWLSSNEIDGPPLSIDVLQLDLNTRF
jgi:hypothetical protein